MTPRVWSQVRSVHSLMWLMLVALIAGCETTRPDTAELELPARFSAPTAMPGLSDPSVGLIVDTDPHPQMQQYGHQLAAMIATEIQLMSGSTQVVPYTDLAVQAPMLLPAYQTVHDPTLQSLNSPLENLPPGVPDAAAGVPATARLLVAQLIYLRPYVPLAATVRLTVVDTQSQMVLAQTTAMWDASQPTSTCGDPHCRKHHLHCWQPECEPSPLQNSPNAMLKLMSQQMAMWYQQTLPQPVMNVPVSGRAGEAMECQPTW
jgi:hypothetical protein